MSQSYDFVAIGDITVDAFIQLSQKDAQVVCDIEGKPCQLMMNFGEKLPYTDVTVVNAVGNAPNASVAARRLGLKSALVTNIGHDRYGKDCLDTLRAEGVSTDYVQMHEGKKTNYHYVLRYGAERTILIKHEAYPYRLPHFDAPPRYIYFSSVGDDAMPFHHEIAAYVKEHPETKLVFQPGTFQIRVGYEALKDLYEVTEIFFCNKEEARQILNSKEDDIPTLLKALKALGPNLPVITDGPKGSYALAENEVWFMPMYPDPQPPVDRTGAGDSFASTFTTALALGKSVQEALTWGPINSMSVVQYIGAQKGLLSRAEIEKYLKEAPDVYQSIKILR
ncbi:carbohydrate kinase family protein [Candidatus Kaiserbacteria bacterium]|nr:carbohydrate kinase family protein [Candidatus Kaiserbacteria bacterium]